MCCAPHEESCLRQHSGLVGNQFGREVYNVGFLHFQMIIFEMYTSMYWNIML